MMSDSIGFWIDRTSSHMCRIYDKIDYLQHLYEMSIKRYGKNDKKTLWYKWRRDKYLCRETVIREKQQHLFDAIFTQRQYNINDSLRRYARNGSDSLKISRKKYGINFKGK